MASGPIKAVFFDLDDTLLHTSELDAAALEEVAAKLAETHPQLPWSDVHGAWLKAFKASPWDKTNKIAVELWRGKLWSGALALQGVDDHEVGMRLQSCYRAERTRRFRLTEQVQALMKGVRARGYKTVLITNGHPEIQRGKIEATQVSTFVGGNILVGGEEIAAGRPDKPHASIFHAACRLVGCKPNEAVHVGDSLAADIQGGINAGLAATVWVNFSGIVPQQQSPHPDYTIKHVCELLPILDRLSDMASDSGGQKRPNSASDSTDNNLTAGH